MVGTVNFTALPAASLTFVELFHNSVAMLVASNACNTAGPAGGNGGAGGAAPWPSVPWAPVSIAHTIPFVVGFEADTDGVAPLKRNPLGVLAVGLVENIPFAGLNVKLSPGCAFLNTTPK